MVLLIIKILFKNFFNAGLQVIPKKNALEKICLALENNDAVAFVLDQHAHIKNKDGIVVDFFGKPAGTYRALAMIAQYTKAPVIPTNCYRRSDGKHVLEFLPPLPWLKGNDEIYINTLQYNQSLEKLICAHPEQWLWIHRRWKINPNSSGM